ncbi:MAG: hypothetical protein QXW56_09265 [Nitrososphaerota archaeon]
MDELVCPECGSPLVEDSECLSCPSCGLVASERPLTSTFRDRSRTEPMPEDDDMELRCRRVAELLNLGLSRAAYAEAARRARRLREELKIMKRNEAAAIAVYSLCREMGVHIPPSVLFRRFRVRPSRMMKSLALLRSPRPDPEEVLESVLDRLQVSGPERGAILRAFRSLTFRNPWVRAAAAVIAVRPDLRRRVAEVTGILSALRRDWPHRLNEPRGRGPSR